MVIEHGGRHQGHRVGDPAVVSAFDIVVADTDETVMAAVVNPLADRVNVPRVTVMANVQPTVPTYALGMKAVAVTGVRVATATLAELSM
jgi:hypothetical protein